MIQLFLLLVLASTAWAQPDIPDHKIFVSIDRSSTIGLGKTIPVDRPRYIMWQSRIDGKAADVDLEASRDGKKSIMPKKQWRFLRGRIKSIAKETFVTVRITAE